MAAAPVPELNPNTAPLGVEEDEDEYEPDFEMAEDTEQILNRLDSEGGARVVDDGVDALVPFSLARPRPPSVEEAVTIGRDAAGRVLECIRSMPDGQASTSAAAVMAKQRPRPGFARPRPGAGLFGRDRESWIKLVCRIAIRGVPPGGGDDDDDDNSIKSAAVKSEAGNGHGAVDPVIGDYIRQYLYQYILEDFRKRIDAAITWLCEEWHGDWRNQRRRRVSAGNSNGLKDDDNNNNNNNKQQFAFPNYETWAVKLMDGFLPYVNAQDKLLTRFLGEIPHVTGAMLARVKHLCRDPAVVSLALNSLLYLIMLKPPAREVALDTMQDIWAECECCGCITCPRLYLANRLLLQTTTQRRWRQNICSGTGRACWPR